MALLLLGISILPVILLLVYIYRQDKYEKEPLGLLILAFVGGIFAILLDLVIVGLLNNIWYSDTVFYSAFMEAGFPEELCKFLIVFLLIWWNKNFNEYMDGIVYATFCGLGFACLENILYVMEGGLGVGIMRAIISVPGHFLFGVMMGYFLSLAKFSQENRVGYLLLSVIVPGIVHGMFDWLLMVTDEIGALGQIIILVAFITLDIFMWIFGVRSIRKHRENSQFKNIQPNV
jgi:RsiW-degrading membrane proteinase PrsW (M82 family)